MTLYTMSPLYSVEKEARNFYVMQKSRNVVCQIHKASKILMNIFDIRLYLTIFEKNCRIWHWRIKNVRRQKIKIM